MSDNDLVDVESNEELAVAEDGETPQETAAPEVEAEAAPEAAAAEVEEPAEEPEGRKSKPGSQKWKERALELQNKVEVLERLAYQQKPAEPAAPAVDRSAPQPEAFDSHAEWVTAQIRYEAQKLLAQEKATNAWEQKIEQGRKEFADFDEAIVTPVMPAPHVFDRMNRPSVPPAVVRYLGQNPEEMRRLNSLKDSADVAEALIEIKAALKPAAAPQKKVTQAPKPPVPVTAAAVATRPTENRYIEVY